MKCNNVGQPLYPGSAHLHRTRLSFDKCLQYKTVAPVGDRVLVKVDVSEEKSMGGILLPASVQKKPTQGHVEKAGTAKAVRVSCGLCAMQRCLSSIGCYGSCCSCAPAKKTSA